MIKLLLEHVEEVHNGNNPINVDNIKIEGFEKIEIIYHARLLADADLIFFEDTCQAAPLDGPPMFHTPPYTYWPLLERS